MTVDWITKEEAASRLGTQERPLSTRRVLELAKEGRLQSDRVLDKKSGQMVVMIHAGSVERFITERDTVPEPAPRLLGEAREPQTSQPLQKVEKQAGELVRLIELLRDRPADRTPSAHPAYRWLTLDEAEGHTGLPANHLKGMIRSGQLLAQYVGRRAGGEWRVRTLDLEKIEGIKWDPNEP